MHYEWIPLEGRDDTQAIIPLVKHRRGYILQPPSINLHNLHTWLSKQMPSVPEGCASGGILSVRCNSGPAEGPGKILKYRSNLRLHPVNFSNKFWIFFFHYTFNLTKLFDLPFTTENILVPPSGNSKLFWPPPFCPAPPQSINEHSPWHFKTFYEKISCEYCCHRVGLVLVLELGLGHSH